MQKIVLEIQRNSKMFDSEPKGAIEITSMLQNIESFRVIYFLRQMPEEFSIILQVRFLKKGSGIESLPFMRFPWINVQVLDFNSSNETYTIFVKGNPPVNSDKSNARDVKLNIFPLSIEIINEKYLITLLTDSEDMSKFIETRKTEGFDFRILSVTKAKLPIGSPLDSLTGKQHIILKESYYSGYYDIPRKINSDQIAKKLGIANSTFVMNRRRAEKRIMSELFGGH